MSDQVIAVFQVIVQLLELIGAVFLIAGFVIATFNWFRKTLAGARREALEKYRVRLGRSVLIGLEILVAATIIKTIALDQSIEGIGLLAGMVLIRAIIGWTTVLEIRGRWPWQDT